MSGETGTSKQIKTVKYKRIRLSDLQFDQGDNFFERGQFGDVKRAKWSGKVVAVKCFTSADRKGGFSEELVCLSLLQKHKHIVEMHGALVSDHQPFIVLEFAPLSLEKVLHECKKLYRYTADHVMSWTYQMAIALDYIHGKEMLHRDIKPSNVLLFDQGQILKLCDFGTAKKLEHTLTNAVGTIRYMAPEVIRGRYYTPRCDVFSFGIVVWEMITRKRPTLGTAQQSNMAILYAMANGARPPQIRDLPKAISEMIDKCWNEEPQNRPPMEEIKAKVGKLCEFVEMNKPLIPRRQPKQQKQEGSEENTLLAALQNAGSGQNVAESSPSKATKSGSGNAGPSESSSSVGAQPASTGGGGANESGKSLSADDSGRGGSESSKSADAGSQSVSSNSNSSTGAGKETTTKADPKEEPVSNAEPPSEENPRDRAATVPNHSAAFTSTTQPTETNQHQFYKQLSSPPTDTPSQLALYPQQGAGSAHYPPHHPTLGQSSSYPAVPGRSVQPGGGVGGGRVGHWGYRHQGSEYGVMMSEVPGVEQSSSEQQVERYKQLEATMRQKDMGDIAGFPRAVIGQSPYAIPSLQPEFQPVVPDENNPESMDLYRQYRAVAEQVVQAKREFDELQDECLKLDKETREDHQKLELNKSILQEYQAHSNDKDHLMNEVQKLQETLNQLRVQNAQFAMSDSHHSVGD